MKKSITVIQGTNNLGKSETLNILVDLLSCVAFDYKIIKYNTHTNDRRGYFIIDGSKICICTAGDNDKETRDNTNFIKEEKPDIVFTACHNTRSTSRSILKKFAEQNGYEFIPERKNDDTQESRRLATKFFIKIFQEHGGEEC